jgi:single-strand DNA-binding protein
MSQDLNQCQFIGRLGRDPEVRYLSNGDACANFSLAVGESWKDKASGEKQERTEWVRCVAWRKLGEIAGEYLKKGSQVYISGKMQTRKWQNKEGQDQYTTEIVLDRIQMLGKPAGDGKASQERDQSTPAGGSESRRPAGNFEDMDDDIPFASCAPADDVIWRRLRHRSRAGIDA